jgi:hypothetical protein
MIYSADNMSMLSTHPENVSFFFVQIDMLREGVEAIDRNRGRLNPKKAPCGNGWNHKL